MANFDFLKTKTEYSAFAAAAIEAERVYKTSPAMCAVGCRKALELAVKWVYAADNTMEMPYRDNLQSLIHEPSFKEALPYDCLLYTSSVPHAQAYPRYDGRTRRADTAGYDLRPCLRHGGVPRIGCRICAPELRKQNEQSRLGCI